MNFTDTIKELAGKRYRVVRGEDGFYQVVLNGRRGHIYQHGPHTLAAHITGTMQPTRTFKAIRAKCPTARIHVMGQDELIILHPVEGWERFFSVCKAKARIVLSVDEHARRVERGRQLQRKPNKEGGDSVPGGPNAP